MKYSDIYLQTSKKYLSAKPNVLSALNFADKYPEKRIRFESELQEAISYYNFRRNNLRTNFIIPWKQLVNASELNNNFPHNLPSLKGTLLLLKNPSLKESVFINLRDNTFFYEVWKIKNPEYLFGNLLILIYRTTFLFSNKRLLLKNDGSQKVQVSSTLEEMLTCLWLEGKKLELFKTVSLWIKNYKTEGFGLEFFKQIKSYL